MNKQYQTQLPNTELSYFSAEAAIEALSPGTYSKLPYTCKVLAENLVRRCDPEQLEASLWQFIDRKRDLDFHGIRLGSFATIFLVKPPWLTWQDYAML